ncbi:MAG TPA: hypothetical protein VGB05_04095, partial [Pyrinomonadaceae bacterium]
DLARGLADEINENHIRVHVSAAGSLQRIFFIQRQRNVIAVPCEIQPQERARLVVVLYQEDARLSSIFTAQFFTPLSKRVV